MKIVQGRHMSQLAAIQPSGRQFVQRGNPGGFRLVAKPRAARECFFRGDAGRESGKSCAQELAPADAPRHKRIVRHLFPLSGALHRWVQVDVIYSPRWHCAQLQNSEPSGKGCRRWESLRTGRKATSTSCPIRAILFAHYAMCQSLIVFII